MQSTTTVSKKYSLSVGRKSVYFTENKFFTEKLVGHIKAKAPTYNNPPNLTLTLQNKPHTINVYGLLNITGMQCIPSLNYYFFSAGFAAGFAAGLAAGFAAGLAAGLAAASSPAGAGASSS